LRQRPSILVAEDYPDFRTAILALFETLEVDCHTVANGRLAIEFIRDERNALDLLITDMDMPVHTGWEVIEALRDCRPRVPIIMQTGEAKYSYVRRRAAQYDVVLLDKRDVPSGLVPAVLRELGSVGDA
jgi:CheY-like chemotaxis protein